MQPNNINQDRNDDISLIIRESLSIVRKDSRQESLRKARKALNKAIKTVKSANYHDAMMAAFDEAADGVEQWEFAGAEDKADAELHQKAAREVARRIRKMADRYYKKWMK